MKINRQMVYDKCNGRCGYCGVEIGIKDMQVDHIVPKADFVQYLTSEAHMDAFVPVFLHHLTAGDVDHIDNLMPSCRSCNNYKSWASLEEFRKQLSKQLERLNKTGVNYRLAKRYGQLIETPTQIVFYFESIKEGVEG